MALPRFITSISGALSMGVPVAASTGTSSASQIVATNANGFIDPTMYPGAPNAVIYASTTAINWANGICQTLTLTGNTTLTFTGMVAGTRYLLDLPQDST